MSGGPRGHYLPREKRGEWAGQEPGSSGLIGQIRLLAAGPVNAGGYQLGEGLDNDETNYRPRWADCFLVCCSYGLDADCSIAVAKILPQTSDKNKNKKPPQSASASSRCIRTQLHHDLHSYEAPREPDDEGG